MKILNFIIGIGKVKLKFLWRAKGASKICFFVQAPNTINFYEDFLILVTLLKVSLIDADDDSGWHGIFEGNSANDFVKQNALALSSLALYHSQTETDS